MDLKDVPDLNARQLLAIVTLAEHGSFTTAASVLELSQPALSRTLQRVERVLGVTLFSRNTRKLDITAAGREVVAVAERMLADLQLTLKNVGEVGTEQRGQVIASTFPMFAHEVFPRLIRRFRESRPNVVIKLRHGCNSEILEDVASGVADFGIAFINTMPEMINCVHVRQDPLFVLIPWSHPLAKTKDKGINLSELRDADVISLDHSSHTQRMIDGAASRLGFALRSVVVAPGFRDVIQHVRAGVGIGIMPSEALPRRRDFALRRLKAPALSMSIGVLTLKGRHLTPAASRLMQMALEYLKSRDTAKAGARREDAA